MTYRRKKWDLTADERGESGTLSVEFTVHDDGRVVISEGWDGMDESWGAGVSVEVPARIWAEAMTWIASGQS